jgi:glycosyltransferase involved in cell wall biosynthesis
MGNGVDSEYFYPAKPVATTAPKLVFTGTMSYRPNADGVCDFVRDVWPGLLKRRPEMKLTIVGRDPTPAVEALAEVPGVTVTGSVPDVRPYLAEAAAAVVPLKIARGIQNKVLEAMSMGRAVVASGPALEGLDVVAGEEVLRADEPVEWLEAINRLLDDAEFRGSLERRARAAVVKRYDWDVKMAPLVETCEVLAKRKD